MFGGTPSRNMVNLDRQGRARQGRARKGRRCSGRSHLGSRAYGGPIVAGGKVFVGTNNEQPRNQRDSDKDADGEVEPIDKGILMCFDEKTGKFLWQAVHDKLAGGQVNDWPKEGICSTPDGRGRPRLLRQQPLRASSAPTSNGFADGNQGVQTEKYKDADRRRRHLGVRHDQGTERLPAQHGGLLAR